MPTKKQMYANYKSSSEQRSSKPGARNWDKVTTQKRHPATIIQRASLDPRSLTPGDMLQLQRTIGNRAVGQLLARAAQQPPIRKNRNENGLPDNLKAGVETLSGMAMDDVTVHYNSAEPEKVRALAYTRGTDIHLGPGQERYLAHEAWHVVQQKQGRVQPTLRAKGVSINRDIALEQEADVMSAKVFQVGSPHCVAPKSAAQALTAEQQAGETIKPSKSPDMPVGAPVEKGHLDSLSALGKSIQQKERKGSDDEHNSLASKPDVIQGYFFGPPQRAIELAYDYVKSVMPKKQKQFESIYNSPIKHVNLYDFLVDELNTDMNEIYNWDDSRRMQQQSHMDLDYDALLASLIQFQQLEMELAKLPMTELLVRALQDSGIPKTKAKDLSLFNMLLDIGSAELKQMDIDTKSAKLSEYHRNWLAYTSCHNTAVKLVSRMTATPGALGPYTGYDKEQAKTQKDGGWLVEVSKGLAAAISYDLNQNNRSIYEVHCGGHGFAILVRSGATEILQSFANAVALVARMQRGPLILKDGQIQKVITDMASSSTSDRDRAADIIADCTAEVFGLVPYPSFQYRWRRQPLLSDVELLNYFKTELQNAFKAIKPFLSFM